MSNDYVAKKIMEIDTSIDIVGNFLVDYLEWHPALKSDTLLVEDDDSNIIWTITAPAGAPANEAYAIEQLKFAFPTKFRGLYITIASAGTLYIHLNQRSPLAVEV